MSVAGGLTSCIPSAKYGLEQYTALRSVFGTSGSRLLVFLIFPPLVVGWNAILAITFGRATTNVSNTIFSASFGSDGPLVVGFALAALAVSCWILYKGTISIWVKQVRRPRPGGGGGRDAPILIFAGSSWAELLAAEPVQPLGDRTPDFMVAIELNLAAGFSWWSIMGNLGRITRTQRVSFWPNTIGIFGAAALATIVGLLAALALGSSDPTEWMVPLGGAALGVLALVFVAFANVTTMVAQTYACALAFLHRRGQRRAAHGVGDPGRSILSPLHRRGILLDAPLRQLLRVPGLGLPRPGTPVRGLLRAAAQAARFAGPVRGGRPLALRVLGGFNPAALRRWRRVRSRTTCC